MDKQTKLPEGMVWYFVSDTHKVTAAAIIHSCHVSFGFAGNRDNGLVTSEMSM